MYSLGVGSPLYTGCSDLHSAVFGGCHQTQSGNCQKEAISISAEFLCPIAPGFVPRIFFQPLAGRQSSVIGQGLNGSRSFGEIAVSYVFLHLIPFVSGQGLPTRRHHPVVTIEICRPGLLLFEHDIHQNDATILAKGTLALGEKSLFFLDGQVVQGVAGIDHVKMVLGSLLQHGDHVPAEQIHTDSQRLQILSGNIESVGGKIASAVLRHLTGVQYFADMGGISTSQVENIERSWAALEQLSYSSKGFAVKHQVVVDDLLVGGPGFAEDVDRVCFHIEDVLPFDINPLMPGCTTVPCANQRELRSARFDGTVQSGKQPGQPFAVFVTSITAIAGKWHEQFSINRIFAARNLSRGKEAGSSPALTDASRGRGGYAKCLMSCNCLLYFDNYTLKIWLNFGLAPFAYRVSVILIVRLTQDMAYEFDGNKYKEASAHQKEWGAKLIHELPVSGTERILDLGCGDGALTAQLAVLAPPGAVVGIDASHGMIEIAKSYQTENLSFEVRDINDLNFENEFDIIFSNAALHWIKNHDALLGKVFCALKRGGVLRFNFAGDGNCANFFNVVKEAIKKPQFASYFSDFVWPWYMPTIEEYELLVRSIPFTESRVWSENADRFFADSETMTKWIDLPSLVPFMKLMPEEHKEDFRQFVIGRMIQKTCQADGRCFETFRRINVLAKK